MELFITIIQLITCLFLIVVILLQSGKSASLSGAISGNADSFFGKGKAKSRDAMFARWTKWVALAFVLLSLVLNMI